LAKRVAESKAARAAPSETTRKYLSQTDVPAWSLDQAIRIPRAIADEHASRPTRPIDVALAMKMQPSTGGFRTLCGAAIAYGLTDGGYNADTISITDLGRRIIGEPVDDPDGLAARREATLRPRVIREFLTRYDGARMPREDVAINMLVGLGVQRDTTKCAFDLIVEAAKGARFFKEINGALYIDLHHTPGVTKAEVIEREDKDSPPELGDRSGEPVESPVKPPGPPNVGQMEAKDPKDNRVFVSHGKKRDLVPQLKEFLEMVDFEPVVSVERESVSKPVTDKVMDDMRLCSAAIIHVDGDREVTNSKGEKETLLNENVLIEIGAALALYRKRFILLVQDGAKLPSNLQGLFEVRYEGSKMDAEAALRLLRSLKDLKNQPVTRIE